MVIDAARWVPIPRNMLDGNAASDLSDHSHHLCLLKGRVYSAAAQVHMHLRNQGLDADYT